MNDVDSYFAYTAGLGTGVRVSTSEQDSLSYQAAENLFMSKDKKARSQFERYLSQFPNGSFVLNSHFYLAELLYAEGEEAKALNEYEQVIAQPENYFTALSLLKAAGLHYNSGNYTQALNYFGQFAKTTEAGNRIQETQTGLMRCQFKLENYKACADAAIQVLNASKISEILKREASYMLGISYYKMGNSDKAFPILSKLSADTNSSEGAESKYLVAQILFDKQKLKESEKEIMDFIDKNSPHQSWLAKTFILLSDIYLKKI